MILGIDIGGTKCAVSLGEGDGRITAREAQVTDVASSPDAILESLTALARKLLREASAAAEKLEGIGISCGGPLSTESGTVFEVPNLPGWTEVPIRKIFEDAFPGIRVVLENDANATALAEWRFGAGKGTRNMIFMTMGTGIGGGLILDGKLYRGTNDLAGEVGHQTILIDGPVCGCGKRGCLEALASGPAIARLAWEGIQFGRGRRLIEIAGGKSADITAQHVIEAAREGDQFSQSILADAGTYMGIGIANLIQILNPERVVLGTIAIHAGDFILEPIRRAVKEYSWSRSNSVCEILPAELGDRAQDLAAISLID
jgi:glucokinase